MRLHLGPIASAVLAAATLAGSIALSSGVAQAGRDCFLQAGVFGATSAVDPYAVYSGPLPSGGTAVRESVVGEELDSTIGFDAGIGCSVSYADGGPFADPPNKSGLRADISYSYRGDADFDGVARVGTPSETIHTEFKSHAVMFSIYYDMQQTGWLQPYIGAGMGAARLSHGAVSVTTGGSPVTFEGSEQWNVAWQLMAGFGVPVSDKVALDFGYRYVNLGDITTTATAFCGCTALGDATLDTDNIEHHEFRLGLRISFGHHETHETYK